MCVVVVGGSACCSRAARLLSMRTRYTRHQTLCPLLNLHLSHCHDLLCHINQQQRLKVLKPLSEPGTFCTTLWRPVKGVLFYGPPGTGVGVREGEGAARHCLI